MNATSQGRKVILWLISSYITVVLTVLLACLLSIPIAWLAIMLNLSEGVFLVVSIAPVTVAIYITQRWRTSEYVINFSQSILFKETFDIGQVQQVRQANAIWGQIKRFRKEETVDWDKLYKNRRCVKKIVSEFKSSVSERQDIIDQLKNWIAISEQSPPLASEVSNMIEKHNKAVKKTVLLASDIADYNRKVIKEGNRLLEKEHVRERLRKFTYLESKLKQAESQLPLTFWAWMELVWRNCQINIYRRSFRQKKEDFKRWSYGLFDPYRYLEKQKSSTEFLRGKEIKCQDGKIIKLDTLLN